MSSVSITNPESHHFWETPPESLSSSYTTYREHSCPLWSRQSPSYFRVGRPCPDLISITSVPDEFVKIENTQVHYVSSQTVMLWKINSGVYAGKKRSVSRWVVFHVPWFVLKYFFLERPRNPPWSPSPLVIVSKQMYGKKDIENHEILDDFIQKIVCTLLWIEKEFIMNR